MTWDGRSLHTVAETSGSQSDASTLQPNGQGHMLAMCVVLRLCRGCLLEDGKPCKLKSGPTDFF